MAAKLTDTEREAILTDIQTGNLSRNAIARKHGRSVGTITNVANEAHLAEPFDRSATVNATRARQVDLAAGRAALQERWLGKANEALDRSERACVVFAFTGMDGKYKDHVMELPPAADYRSFVTAAAVATDKMVVLAKLDASDDGLVSAVSTIDKIMNVVRGVSLDEATDPDS